MTQPHRFRAGQVLAVVSTPAMPGGQKPPFKEGDRVVCRHVSPAGSILTDKHGGYFPAHRFTEALS